MQIGGNECKLAVLFDDAPLVVFGNEFKRYMNAAHNTGGAMHSNSSGTMPYWAEDTAGLRRFLQVGKVAWRIGIFFCLHVCENERAGYIDDSRKARLKAKNK